MTFHYLIQAHLGIIISPNGMRATSITSSVMFQIRTNRGRLLNIHYSYFNAIDLLPKALICSNLLGHIFVAHGAGRT